MSFESGQIVIANAAGNIGRRTAEFLLSQGQKPVLLVRNAAKVQDLADRGAVLRVGDLDSGAYLEKATEGARILLWLTPPAFTQHDPDGWAKQLAHSVLASVKSHRIERIVNISGLGADYPGDHGTLTTIRDVEVILNASKAAVTHLRPGWFMENFFAQVPSIVNHSAIFSAMPESHEAPFISTDDIGDFAGQVILDSSWTGQRVLNLIGPGPLSMSTAAEILSNELGRSIRWVTITFEALDAVLQEMGATENARLQYGKMFRVLSDPAGPYAQASTSDGYTPTTLAQFVRTKLQPALARGQAAGRP